MGGAGYHERGFQKRKPPWRGMEGTLGVSGRQGTSQDDQMNPVKVLDSKATSVIHVETAAGLAE